VTAPPRLVVILATRPAADAIDSLCNALAPAIYFIVVGLSVILFVLYLASALLNKKRPQDAERHVTMLSFLLLVPTILTQHLPPLILPLLSLFFAAYLHKAR